MGQQEARGEKNMITLSKRWKDLFWGCTAACAVLIILSLLTRLILLFALGLLAGIVVCVMATAKLRCPECGKVLIQEAQKARLEGEITCPKCDQTYTLK